MVWNPWRGAHTINLHGIHIRSPKHAPAVYTKYSFSHLPGLWVIGTLPIHFHHTDKISHAVLSHHEPLTTDSSMMLKPCLVIVGFERAIWSSQPDLDLLRLESLSAPFSLILASFDRHCVELLRCLVPHAGSVDGASNSRCPKHTNVGTGTSPSPRLCVFGSVRHFSSWGSPQRLCESLPRSFSRSEGHKLDSAKTYELGLSLEICAKYDNYNRKRNGWN